MQGEGTDENILGQSIHCLEEGGDQPHEQYAIWNTYLIEVSLAHSIAERTVALCLFAQRVWRSDDPKLHYQCKQQSDANS